VMTGESTPKAQSTKERVDGLNFAKIELLH
jgi:hypothetical protein